LGGRWTASAPAATICGMERHAQPRQPPSAAGAEVDVVRLARIRRDLALTPSQRLDKFAALCRQADLLRSARRLP
jgi:hypothetical protein